MALPATLNISAYRGDDWSLTGQVLDEDTSLPIADYFASVTNAVVEVRTSRSTAAAITFTQAASEISFNGSFFTLTKDDASTDIPGGTYRYDLQCTQGGLKKTLVRGEFVVVDDITQST